MPSYVNTYKIHITSISPQNYNKRPANPQPRHYKHGVHAHNFRLLAVRGMSAGWTWTFLVRDVSGGNGPVLNKRPPCHREWFKLNNLDALSPGLALIVFSAAYPRARETNILPATF
jgi:hypothetical protein